MGQATDTANKTINKMKSEMNSKILLMADELFSNVVRLTPVDKGYLINNWFTATEGYSDATTEVADRSGQRSDSDIAVMAKQTPFLEKDSQVSLSNSLSYAYQANSVGWFRTPAYHMVEGAIAIVKNKVYK